jgi:multiple sugar transport system permease protein
LGDPDLAIWSLVIVDVWNTTAFVALLVLAGLASIPDEPRQAARVDGASPWQVFRYITLPLLRPFIFIAIVWRTVDLFRIFDVVWVLTSGGPYNATETISIYAYRQGFASFNLGFASAVSYLIILSLLIILAIEYLLVGRRRW